MVPRAKHHSSDYHIIKTTVLSKASHGTVLRLPSRWHSHTILHWHLITPALLHWQPASWLSQAWTIHETLYVEGPGHNNLWAQGLKITVMNSFLSLFNLFYTAWSISAFVPDNLEVWSIVQEHSEKCGMWTLNSCLLSSTVFLYNVPACCQYVKASLNGKMNFVW